MMLPLHPRNNLLLRIASTAALALAFCGPVFGWGTDGHKIIALIATAHLTPAARQDVQKFLGPTALVDIANWPDQVRNERPETAPWHFVDIPASQPSYDPKRDGNNGNNVIDALAREETALADPKLSLEKRGEALSFVVHFVGDLHQPMHCVDRNHDQGGNKRLVFFLDQPRARNLHSVWDSSIIREEMNNASDAVFASALDARISHEDAEKWAKGTPVDWANESHELAVNVAYAGVSPDGPPPKLNEAYLKKAEETVNLQLQRAGIRLASILNRILQ